MLCSHAARHSCFLMRAGPLTFVAHACASTLRVARSRYVRTPVDPMLLCCFLSKCSHVYVSANLSKGKRTPFQRLHGPNVRAMLCTSLYLVARLAYRNFTIYMECCTLLAPLREAYALLVWLTILASKRL